MKLMISYFYKVRFFKPTMVPLSTAVWDPKWYHAFKSQDYIYLDKRGVINGMRFEPFMPDESCKDLCRGPETCISRDPHTCKFLSNYKEMLNKINFNDLLTTLKESEEEVQQILKIDKEITFVFMVHEPPYKLCSERQELVRYFSDNNYLLEEVD